MTKVLQLKVLCCEKILDVNGYPTIIQGGMGAGVSHWGLAQAVSRLGQLGVVSGTALDQIFVRRLQDGDPGGHMRRAMAHFPIPGAADEVLRRFYLARGRAAEIGRAHV